MKVVYEGKEFKVEGIQRGGELYKLAGYFDKAGRWWPRSEFIVPGSFKVRKPSRAYPNSYLEHFYTKKYAELLATHRPDLYYKLFSKTN